MELSDMLLARMADLANKAIKVGCASSKFITPSDSQEVTAFFLRRRDVDLSFDGGFKDAERRRAVFTNPDWGVFDRDELFAALKITHRQQDDIGHRDILGALMSLGLERETIGDIIIAESSAVFVCLPELSGYISENLTKVGNVGVEISRISLDDLPAHQEELTVKTDTVASLRLDVVLCAAFGLSRTKASELIAARKVRLDHQICLQSKEININSLFSIRGMGRAKLLEIGGVSRKGKIFIKIGLYSR